jgi:hypothetical protein
MRMDEEDYRVRFLKISPTGQVKPGRTIEQSNWSDFCKT